MKITILTPTYNRAHMLPDLYKSLKEQTCKDFQWLIVDDGSTDNTESVVKAFDNSIFEIDYVKKKNGGKHTALNYSHKFIKSDLLIIVDSDDVLVKDAIDVILNDWDYYSNYEDVLGLSYQKITKDGEIKYYVNEKDNYYLSNHISYRINGGIKGDRCEVIRSQLFIKHNFPEHENEKFMLESWLWNTLASEGYETVYINKPIYVYEYLDDGLTNIARSLRFNNPLGSIDDAKTYFLKDGPKVSFKIRLKMGAQIWAFAFKSRTNLIKMLKAIHNPLALVISFPLGVILYFYWNPIYC